MGLNLCDDIVQVLLCKELTAMTGMLLARFDLSHFNRPGTLTQQPTVCSIDVTARNSFGGMMGAEELSLQI